MHIYLIRHGESEGNKLGRIQGWKDFCLSELGERQVELLADYAKDLPLDAIYSSDLIRAYDSANAIALKKRMSVHKWEMVREVYLGPFQGLTQQEIYENYFDGIDRSIYTSGVDGTETTTELNARCQSVLAHLIGNHQNQHVAIISHGGFISIFLMYLFIGEKWEQYHNPFVIGNTGITHIEWTSGVKRPIVHYVNHNHHLQTLNQKTSFPSL